MAKLRGVVLRAQELKHDSTAQCLRVATKFYQRQSVLG